MLSVDLQHHVERQARSLFSEGGYEASCAAIPRCGRMLVPRYTVRHVANHLRAFTGPDELRSFLHMKANREERILIAWAFVRIIEATEHGEAAEGRRGHGHEHAHGQGHGRQRRRSQLPSAIRTERLLHLDAMSLCQLGFWLHLNSWPEFHCPSYRDSACGKCTLEPAR